MSNPILPAGTAERTSDPFLLMQGSKRTFAFLGSGSGTIQLRKVTTSGAQVDVPNAALSATNGVFNVEGDGYYVWYRAATGTACGCE